MLRSRADIKALREIAQLIAGDAASEWLVKLLAVWLDGLKFSRIKASVEPTRSELVSRLDQFCEAADLIFRELQATGLGKLLEPPSPDAIPDEDLAFELIKLAARAERAKSNKLLIDDSGATRKGQGPVRLIGILPPELYCAVMIAEAWKFFRGKVPGPYGVEVAKIAEKFWRLAEGDAHEAGDDPLACWAKRFVEAIRGSSNLEREAFLQRLREAARAMLAKYKSTNGLGPRI